MISQKAILSYLKLHKQDYLSRFGLVSIALFGSYAQGTNSVTSDIDLLVEFEENTPNLSHVKAVLKAELQKHFELDVDICREKYIKPYFKTQILNSAIYV